MFLLFCLILLDLNHCVSCALLNGKDFDDSLYKCILDSFSVDRFLCELILLVYLCIDLIDYLLTLIHYTTISNANLLYNHK